MRRVARYHSALSGGDVDSAMSEDRSPTFRLVFVRVSFGIRDLIKRNRINRWLRLGVQSVYGNSADCRADQH